MKKSRFILGLVLGISCVVSTSTFAQEVVSENSDSPLKGVNIGVHFGPNLFFGDVKQYSLFPIGKYQNERKIAYGLQIGKELNSFLDCRLQIVNGKLSGTIRPSKFPTIKPNDMYFLANMFEINANAKLDIMRLISAMKSEDYDKMYSFYTYAGLGFNAFSSKLKGLYMNPINTSTSGSALVIPVGLGVDFSITDHIKANVDFSLRFTTSDKIDGLVSTFRGGNDKYSYSSIGVRYVLGNPKKKDKPQVVEQVVPEPVTEPKVEEVEKVAVDSAVKDSASMQNVSSSLAEKSKVDETEVKLTEELQPVPVPETKTESITEENPKVIVEEKHEAVTEEKTEVVAESKPELKPEPKAESKPVAKTETISPSKTEQKTAATPKKTAAKSSSTSISKLVVEFRVQIMALHENGYNKITKLKKQFSITEPIVEERIDGWYKYTVGSYPTLDEAQKLKQSFAAKGNSDVFIVAYNNGKRVTIAEAQAQLKK